MLKKIPDIYKYVVAVLGIMFLPWGAISWLDSNYASAGNVQMNTTWRQQMQIKYVRDTSRAEIWGMLQDYGCESVDDCNAMPPNVKKTVQGMEADIDEYNKTIHELGKELMK